MKLGAGMAKSGLPVSGRSSRGPTRPSRSAPPPRLFGWGLSDRFGPIRQPLCLEELLLRVAAVSWGAPSGLHRRDGEGFAALLREARYASPACASR